jgi:hypothetical protein
MTARLGRRDFLTLLGGAAIAGLQAASAQPSSKVYRLGTLSPGAPVDPKNPFGSILVRALAQRGFSSDTTSRSSPAPRRHRSAGCRNW